MSDVTAEGHWITLTRDQWITAALVGLQRQITAITNGQVPRSTYGARQIYDASVLGAVGEFAVSEVLDVRWNMRTDKPDYGGDLADGVEVRARADHRYDLIVNPDDRNDRPYVLVTGVGPRLCVRGWMFGADAKQPQWWRQVSDLPPSYFVPQRQLHRISELITYIRDPGWIDREVAKW